MGLQEDYDLNGSCVFDRLEPPPEPEAIDGDLWAAIQRARHANPAQRQLEDFRSYFVYCERLNETELYGAMMALKPHPNITPKQQHEMYEIVLEYIAKFKEHQRYPKMWDKVNEKFEAVLKDQWFNTRSVGRSAFVRGSWERVSLFIDKDILIKLENDLETDGQPETYCIAAALSTGIGGTLYECQRQRLQWIKFNETVKSGINSLIHNNCNAEEYVHFNNLMKRETTIMEETGFATFEETALHVKFLDVEKMEVTVLNINDSWRLPADADLRGIAINAEQLVRMPWEKLVLGGCTVIGLPETLKVPEECLTGARKCRSMALDILGPEADSMTLSDMRKLISKNIRQLYAQDRSWKLEETYLLSYAEDLLMAQLEDKVIGFFPTTMTCDAKITTDRVVSQIARIKTTRQCEALSVSFTKELNTIIGTLMDLGKGVSPDSNHIGRFSSFHKRALKAAENWCTAKVDGGGNGVPSQALFGKLAIEWMYETTLAKFEAGNVALPDEMRDLRAFQWLLSKEQENMVAEWFKRAVRLLRTRQGTQCIKDGASSAVKDIDVTVAATTAPEVTVDLLSGSSSSMDHAGKTDIVTKSYGSSQDSIVKKSRGSASKAKTLASADPKCAMASLFGGKAVVKTK